jgi:hypothetical protein
MFHHHDGSRLRLLCELPLPFPLPEVEGGEAAHREATACEGDLDMIAFNPETLVKTYWALRGGTLSQKAEKAYGSDFVRKSLEVSANLGIPHDWLLAAIAWETTEFQASGPPWPLNKSDGGGGLIGFTPLKGHAAESKGPVEQLELVEKHYRKWMTTLKITTFKSPEDLYLIVRGPYGIGKKDTYNMGAGLTKGDVVRIYRTYLVRQGVIAG